MNRTENAIPGGRLLSYAAWFAGVGKVAQLAACILVLLFVPAIIPTIALSHNYPADQSGVTLAADLGSRQPRLVFCSETTSQTPPKFYYPNPLRPYMKRLKENYHLAEMTAEAQSDIERVKIICNWVHQQWEHQGNCPVQPNDPIAILEAARKGSKFSCYEYSLVAAACLSSIGIKSRIVVLLPQDVEYRYDGNYHVVAEAYLKRRRKWVMVDAQFNAVPTLNQNPLCLIELQNALVRYLSGNELTKRLDEIDFGNLNEEISSTYPRDLFVYLYYFYTPCDNRVVGAKAPENFGGGVMLVPSGESAPRSFAQAPIGDFITTNAVTDFYRQVTQP
ncbi:MAG: transglutaminase-like domain-containing protein [Calditrichota bacterium]